MDIKVRIGGTSWETLLQGFVGTFGLRMYRFADIVQHSKHSWRGLALNQLTHNLVIKILNGLKQQLIHLHYRK